MSIYGNPIGGPPAIPDWKETDPTAGGYIKNKPDVLESTGGTMTGALNVLTPTENANAANKAYVDTAAANAEANAEANAKAYVDGRTAKGTATLTASGWSDGYQAVAVTGVTADNSVFVSVPESSYEAYTDSEIRCVEQSAGSLKFKCESAPSDDIAVDILIIN